MRRYRLDGILEEMAESADGDWVRFDEAWALNEKVNAALAREHDMSDRANAVEDQLAAANALLERCRAGVDWNQYDDPVQNQIGRDLDAHLAGQAAPTTCRVCKRELCSCYEPGCDKCHCQAGPPP